MYSLGGWRVSHDRRVLVTGATGFVGRRLTTACSLLPKVMVTAAVRKHARLPESVHQVRLAGMDAQADWGEALRGVDVVVHLAARVHLMNEGASDPLGEFRRVNVAGTLNLARQAAGAGVRRFVFISSIKVNGEWTEPGLAFKACDRPAPLDPYGISKAEAEEGLWELAAETGMEVVIIRPPVVYGPGVKGNFINMVRLVDKGLPLPLGAVRNKRSLVALDNLVDLIITCIDHPAAANQVFLVGDGKDLSTTELLRGVGQAMGKPARLIPVPVSMLMFGASLLGKKALAQRLLGSLQVDISKTRNLLDWEPPLSVEEGLHRCFISENEY